MKIVVPSPYIMGVGGLPVGCLPVGGLPVVEAEEAMVGPTRSRQPTPDVPLYPHVINQSNGFLNLASVGS